MPQQPSGTGSSTADKVVPAPKASELIPEPHSLSRSSIESYISIVIAIVCVVYAVTWFVKLILLSVLLLFVLNACWYSPWTIHWKNGIKAMLSVAFLLLLVVVSWKPLRKQYLDETRPPLSTLAISSFATNMEYKEGEDVGGVTWKNGLQDVRLVIEDTGEQPAQNLVLTVQVMPDSGDTIVGMGQLTNIPAVQIEAPQLPDIHIQLKGANGGTADYSLRDRIEMADKKGGLFGAGDQYSFLCDRLPSGVPLRMVIASVPKIPTKLRVFGTYEKMPSEGSKMVKIDKIVDVSRL